MTGQLSMPLYLKIFKMKKLLLLMFFFTSISNAQVAPFGMFTNQTIIIGDFSGPSKIYLGQNVPLSNSILGGTWSSLNPSVATIDSTTGEITGVGLGTATINYQITQNGRTESDTKTVEVTESLAIGTGYGGGVIAYIYQSGDPGYSSTEITMLIAAINDFPETLTWYLAGLRSWNSGCISCNPDNLLLGAGQTNTENIAFNLSTRGQYPPNDYIFGAISSFRDGDFEDWFVPSRDELIKVQLQKDAINGFSASNYWTSNDDMSNSRGTTVNFADGSLFAKAKNVVGATRLIRYASFTPSAPGAPTNLAATVGNGEATVAFEAPISNGYAITEYTVTSNPGSHTQSGTNSPIIVTGLTNGTEYTFKVTATNAVGTSTFSVASSAVTPAAVPSVPTNVTANAGNGQATVTFEAPISDGGSTITEYTVTSSNGNTQTGASSPITVTGLTNGTAYTFTVTAKNVMGTSGESSVSNAVTPATVPGAPTNVAANAGNGQATVTFEAPISDGGSTITEYTVTSNPGSHTQTGASSPITVTGLTNGTAYTFTVTASNSVGPSGASLASSVITPMATVPGVPTNVTANAGNGQATVTFEAPISDGGYSITGYTVTSNDGLIQNGASSPITVTGLTNGTAYTFKVTATNALGTSGESSVSNAVTPAPVPSPPTNVFAVTGNREATVTFEAPISDGGYAITGYTVTSNDGLIQNGSKSPIVIKSLVKRNLYTFTVTATNPMGTSDASSESNQIKAVASPGAPILLADKPIGDRQVTLKFKAPLDDGGTPVTSYTAFCYKEDGKTLVGTISVDAADVPSTTKSIVYTGLTNGTKYGFRIIAYNSVGSSPKGTNLQYATLD